MMKLSDTSHEYIFNTTQIFTKPPPLVWSQANLALLAHFAYLKANGAGQSQQKQYGCFYSPTIGVLISREIISNDDDKRLYGEPHDSAIITKPVSDINEANKLAYNWYKKMVKERGTDADYVSAASPPSESGKKRGRPPKTPAITQQPSAN